MITLHLSCLCHFPVQIQIFRRVEKERNISNLPLICVILHTLKTLCLQISQALYVFVYKSISAPHIGTSVFNQSRSVFVCVSVCVGGGVAMNEWERKVLEMTEVWVKGDWIEKSKETLWNKLFKNK